LLPLTTGSSLAIQFSSYCDLPAVIHIGRIVPEAEFQATEMPARCQSLTPPIDVQRNADRVAARSTF